MPQPAVLWSEDLSATHTVKQIFIDNGKNWLTTTGFTGHGFTIKLSDCKINVAGIKIKNTVNGEYRNRAMKQFHVSGAKKSDLRWYWEQLLEEEFEDPLSNDSPNPQIETFYFNETVQTQLLKFEVESFWGNLGGGLDFFEVITVSGNYRFKFLPASDV